MNRYWHQHPDTIDKLAAEYALGTMPAAARRRFEAVMAKRPDIHQAVWAWHHTLADTLAAQKPMPVDPAQWQRLQTKLFGAEPKQQSKNVPWWSRWFAPIPSGMLTFGLMAGLGLPTLLQVVRDQGEHRSQLPESYVGVLATQQGQAGLVISSLRHGNRVDIKLQTPYAVPSGQTLYLWLVTQSGQMKAITALPDTAGKKFISVDLSGPAEVIFKDAHELAVSVEPIGAAPSQPSGVFVYRGLCGKVWQPPAN